MADRPADLLVLAPLRIEATALRRGVEALDVRRLGFGRRAEPAARRFAQAAASTLAVAGFGGALTESLGPGDVVVATEVRLGGSVTRCHDVDGVAREMEAQGLAVRCGPIVTSARVAGARWRRELARTGALAVEMESGLVARSAPGKRIVAVRAIVDAPGRELWDPLATLAGARKAFGTLRQVGEALDRWAREQEVGGAARVRVGSSP